MRRRKLLEDDRGAEEAESVCQSEQKARTVATESKGETENAAAAGARDDHPGMRGISVALGRARSLGEAEE